MPEENPKGKIERLGEKLDSRARYEPPQDLREPITPRDGEEPPTKWDSPEINDLLSDDRRQPEPYPLIKKVFFVALVFFICAISAAALIYLKGDNFISTKNLDIAVEGPASVSAGSPVALHITITNKNNAPIEKLNMHVIYPDGTRSAVDGTTPVKSLDENIGSLSPGGDVTKDQNVVFFGSEGEVKKVTISVNYRVAGSNAVFTKDKEFDLTIGSAPVSISVTRPDAVVSGDSFTSTITVVDNSEQLLRNVILEGEFPYGWNFVSASPPTSDQAHSVWALGDLSPGTTKTITLQGSLTGEDNDERTFRFFVGVGSGQGTSIDTNLASNSFVIAINHPALSVDVKLNGSSATTYAAASGKPIQAIVTVKNNLPENLLNPKVEVKLSGTALDRNTISPQGTLFNSITNSAVWDQSTTQNFASLTPGGYVSFTINFASLPSMSSSVNPQINLTATLTGQPQGSNANASVSASRTVKVTSEVALTSQSLYSRGPFKNVGPIPPKANTETSYTIDLNLGNTSNDIKDAKVTAVLGPNVSLTDDVSPSGEITYDAGTRSISWNVGTLVSGAGFSNPGREAFVRLSLTPSLGQVGGVPVLLTNIVFTGIDSFSGSAVRITNSSVTTRISSDPTYVQGDETVVK